MDFETIGAALAVLGAFGSVIVFLKNQHAQTQQAIFARYDGVHESYIDYMNLCLEHPQLQTSWYTHDQIQPLTDPKDIIQRDIMFDILTSMLENAFVSYARAPKAIRKTQWPGWSAFIHHFAGRDDYRSWWSVNVGDFTSKQAVGSSQYDEKFERFMLAAIKSERGKSPVQL